MFIPISSGSFAYEIAKSIRLRGSNSASLSWVPSAPGNRKTWTWRGLVKRGSLGSTQGLAGAGTTGTGLAQFFGFETTGQLLFSNYNVGTVYTVGAFRDPAAKYDVIINVDTTQPAQADRLKIYVNGVRQTLSGTVPIPTQNSELAFNNAVAHSIGNEAFGTSYKFDGYLSEIIFIDGQALGPEYFGYFDTSTNSQRPKKYTGAYGTNGFYLPFNDGTNLTTLGQDRSGNGNNWTCNGISLTAGATYDWMADGTDNYAVVNPLNRVAGDIAVFEANLRATSSYAQSAESVFSTIGFSTGKWYCEVITNVVNNAGAVGVSPATVSPNVGFYSAAGGVAYYPFDGSKIVSGVNTAYGAACSTADVIGIAVDKDAGLVTFYKNGVSQGTISVALYGDYVFAAGDGSGSAAFDYTFNFGQRPFAFAPPFGFKALCTKNLPEPTGAAKNPKKHFDAVPYVGNGGTKNVTGSAFQPSLVWMKNRGAVYGHHLVDSVRGVGKHIFSNATDAEYNYGAVGVGLTSFDAGGFSIAGAMEANYNANSYISWLWKAGSAPVANTAGSIASQVSGNVEAGFSIVTYTGIGTAGTVGHGLGSAPKFIIVKSRDGATTSWYVYHASSDASPQGQYLLLNGNDAKAASTSVWNNTQPTSSVFSIGTSASNTSGQSYVAYCFAEIPGYSKIDKYIGNGSADGQFVWCGFRPRYVLIKRTDATGDWQIIDADRSTYNAADARLWADLAYAEVSNGGGSIDFLSNGFKLRNSNNDDNASGGTYILYAIAEQTFKYANAR